MYWKEELTQLTEIKQKRDYFAKQSGRILISTLSIRIWAITSLSH